MSLSPSKQQQSVMQINRHTLWIAGQIYQLRNIARVQCLDVRPGRVREVLRIAWGTFLTLVLLVGVNVVAQVAMPSISQSSVDGLNIFAIAIVSIIVLILLSRAVFRRNWYVLLLETNGNLFSILASRQRVLIEQLVATSPAPWKIRPCNPSFATSAVT